jgi:peptidyl-prolyl cis-trans isomerase C
VPLAATVNGYEITIGEYQSELALYQAALGAELSPEDEQYVLDDLIDQALMAQAANNKGFSVEDSLLEERRGYLIDQLGSEGALSEWLSKYQFDEPSFQRALTRAISAAWMRDQILAEVPRTAEQVHAIQILVYDADEAAEVLAQLQAGNSFNNLAIEYDPITGGDLGWFPRGFLPDPRLDEVAFDLAPGEFSPVIETLAGYHILQVVERESQRVLSPEAYLALQAQALEIWLEKERSNSDIRILLP